MLHCEHLEGGHSRSSEHQRQNYGQNVWLTERLMNGKEEL